MAGFKIGYIPIFTTNIIFASFSKCIIALQTQCILNLYCLFLNLLIKL